MAWNVKKQCKAMAIAFHVTAWDMPHSSSSLEAISYQAHELTVLQGLGKLHRLPGDAVRQLAWNVKEQRNTLAIAFHITAWDMSHSSSSLETISYQAHEPTTLQGLGKLHRLPVDVWNV